jgi:hypothetical protein
VRPAGLASLRWWLTTLETQPDLHKERSGIMPWTLITCHGSAWSRFCAFDKGIECAMVIPMVIQTILLDPSGPDQTDAASNVSRQDPTGAVQSDAEHLARNRKVVLNPAPLG